MVLSDTEISLAGSTEDILEAVKRLKEVGYVTEFDKLLNSFAMEHLANKHAELLAQNGYQGKLTRIGGYSSQYGAYYGIFNPDVISYTEVQACLSRQLKEWLDNSNEN